MKTIELSSNKLKTIFQELQEQLGGDISERQKEFRLSLDNEVATGEITGAW